MARRRGPDGKFAKAPANLGEQTAAQQPDAYGGGAWGGGFGTGYPGSIQNMGLPMGMFPMGGTFGNPMGFPGWGSRYFGNPQTYRFMLAHPTLQLVKSIRTGIIYASIWEYEKIDKSLPDSVLKLVTDQLNALRNLLLSEGMSRAHDYGWCCGEMIWDYIDATHVLRIKPLLQDVSRLVQDENGNVISVKNTGQYGITPQLPKEITMPYKAWTYAYQGEAGYHYGRSWLENQRVYAWPMWMDGAQQLQRLGVKISGVVTLATTPSGTFLGPVDPATGKAKLVTYQEQALKVIKALAEGAPGAWIPGLNIQPDSRGGIDALKLMVQLVNKSQIDFKVLDFGSVTPAITGILEKMKHAEVLMFAGGLRSSRTGLEGQHGTKEEAGVHTDTGTLNASADDINFAEEGVQPLADAIVALNARPSPGGIRVKPVSLVDRQQATTKAVLLSLINDKNISWETGMALDMDYLIKQAGMRLRKPFEYSRLEKVATNEAEPEPAPVPGTNGNGQSQPGKANKGGVMPQYQKKSPNPQGGRPPLE
jgi:hypothetical protein